MPRGGEGLIPDADFIALFESVGPDETAKRIGCTKRAVFSRRTNLEKRYRRQITAPGLSGAGTKTRHGIEHPHRVLLTVEEGTVVIGSDAHYWPDIVSTAHKAFVRFCDELRPKAVILNGDVFDGARISRHPPIGWEKRPGVIDEVGACHARLSEIRKAARKAELVWTLGNHDSRFETRLATVAPEFAKVHGVHLRDHFPDWRPCWSAWINDSVVVKHRYKNGIHATHNNTIGSGKSIVTGHLHSLKVTPFSDYNGTRWGVDTGTLADPGGPQFLDYLEDSPTNWRSGFVVLTFHRSRLLWPEIVHVVGENEVEFRGKVLSV